MFSVLNKQFDPLTSCKKSISAIHFNPKNISCFDNDGFELSKLEQKYYSKSLFQLSNHLNHQCLQFDWLKIDHPNLLLDHALLLERKDFQENAREQLEKYGAKFPQLRKYLNVIPKWGFDFAIEYYDENDFFEVLHFEYDYDNYEEAEYHRNLFQKKVLETDWEDFALLLKKRKEDWIALKGFSQNDYKARLWGLVKAEETLKSFA